MSEVREGYKMTEIGEVPVDWESKSLGESCIIIMGQSPKGETYNADNLGMPLLNGPTEFGERYPVAVQWTSEPTKVCEENDILFTVRGSSIGRMNIADKQYCIGRGLAAIRQSSETTTAFINYVLEYNLIKVLKNTAGSTFPNITKEELYSFQLALPKLKEQQKIAEILSTVDTQIEQTEQLIEKTKELKKGLMQQLLTKGIGHTEFKQSELGEIPTCWDITSLESVSITKGSYGIGAKAIDFDGSKPRYLRITDFNEDGYLLHNDIRTFEDTNDYDDYLLEPGDIVFARTGNSTGKVYRYKTSDGELVFAGFLIRFKIKPDVADVSFVFYQTQTQRYKDWIKKMSMRSGQPGINSKEYGDLQLFLPSLDEQQKIAEILSTVDEQIETYEKEKAKYEKLKKGLMQQLLTGKVRVKID